MIADPGWESDEGKVLYNYIAKDLTQSNWPAITYLTLRHAGLSALAELLVFIFGRAVD